MNNKYVKENFININCHDDQIPRIKIYNFRRPDKFSRDQIRTISIIYETFAHQASFTLSSSLRTEVILHVKSVDQCTYEEFVLSSSNPSVFGVFQSSPLYGKFIIALENEILFAMLDRAFGGSGELRKLKINREITRFEAAFIEKILVDRLFKDLENGWSRIIKVRNQLERLEVNPQFVQIIPPSDMVVVVMLKINIGDQERRIFFCLPYITLEPIVHRLSGQNWYAMQKKRAPSESFLTKLADLKSDSVIYTPVEKLSLSKLSNLKKGDCLRLSEFHEHTAYLRVQNKNIFQLKKVKEQKKDFNEFTILNKGDSFPNSTIIPLKKNDRDNEIYLPEWVSQIQKMIASFNDQLLDIQNKQDELTDQISFSHSQGRKEELEEKPFHFIHQLDPVQFFTMIQYEHPQLLAFLFSYLEAAYAAQVIDMYSEEMQAEILHRIKNLQSVTPQLIKDSESLLKTKMSIIENERFCSSGGMEQVEEIIQFFDKESEKRLVSRLDDTEADIQVGSSKKISRMNLSQLNSQQMKLILEKLDDKDRLILLHYFNGLNVTDYLNSLDDEARTHLQNNIYQISNAKPIEISDSVTRVYQIIEELKEEGIF
ncbi:MAG: hypothetical protein MJB14_00635 [Spirochaetes bacterium]|nr:hypothetical protein [Spirochaetota bacterium]